MKRDSPGLKSDTHTQTLTLGALRACGSLWDSVQAHREELPVQKPLLLISCLISGSLEAEIEKRDSCGVSGEIYTGVRRTG